MRVAPAVLAVALLVAAGCTGAPATDTASEPRVTESPSVRLSFNSVLNESVRVAAERADDGETVVNETYPPEVGIVTFRDELADGVDYDVTVRTDDRVLWERRIGAAEAYKLTIWGNGTVTETHTES